MKQDKLAIKRAFATMPVYQAMAQVKLGFELETQAVNGKEYDELRRVELTETQIQAKVTEYLDRFRSKPANKLPNRELSGMYSEVYAVLLAELTKVYQSDSWVTPNVNSMNRRSQFMRYMLGADLTVGDLYTDEVRQAVYDIKSQATVEYHDKPNLPRLPRGIQAKYDSSVSGPEFVVAGSGKPIPQCLKLLRRLLRRFDLAVDDRCSFHVHVSVPGLKHYYGANLQAYMYEYLLNNLHRVPDSVLKRWQNEDQRDEYFQLRIQDHKYSFVHYHARCKTWEFRCFGDVSDFKSGAKCFKLAVEALQYAYRVSLGLESSDVSGDTWSESAANQALRYENPLRQVLCERAKKAKEENRNAA